MKRTLGLAALAVLLLAGPAQAATVEFRFTGKEDVLVGRTETRPYDMYAFTYRADPGEANRAAMTFSLSGGGYQVTDPGATFRNLPPTCTVSGPTVQCRPPNGASLFRDTYIELGDGNDEALDHGAQVRIDAGPGDDHLKSAGVVSGAIWIGGTGADRLEAGNTSVSISYAGRSAPVAVTLDGRANDGAAGEEDNVTGAPGEIRGGEAGDNLAGPASTAQRPGGFRLYGNGGNDELRTGAAGAGVHGGPGADRIFGGAGTDWIDGGPGADLIRGGGGRDRVLYEDSPAGVTVNLGGRGDDDVGADVEEVFGSPHADVIVGTAGNDTLLGGLGGADRLDGRAGDDQLNLTGSGGDATGGPGRDRLTVNGGHTLRLRDGEPDVVECSGLGVMTVERDAFDQVARCLLPALAYRGRSRLRVSKKGWARLPLNCSGEGRPCFGLLTLRVGRRVIGRRKYNVAPGAKVRLPVRLTKAGRKRLGRARKLRARVAARQTFGATKRIGTVTLLRPRR